MRLSAVNFIRNVRSKSFNNGIVHNRVAFKVICTTFSGHNTELFYKLLTRATEYGWSMGGCNFRKTYPSMYQNVKEGNFLFFWQEIFKVFRILLSGTWSLPFHYGFCWSHEHSQSRKTQSLRKLYLC